MQIFSKVLRDTDVHVRFSFPTHCLEHLDFAGIMLICMLKIAVVSCELFVAWREMEFMTSQCFLWAGLNLLLIMDWELVTRLFFIVRMTITWGRSSWLKLRGESCCLVRRLGVMWQELTSYYPDIYRRMNLCMCLCLSVCSDHNQWYLRHSN